MDEYNKNRKDIHILNGKLFYNIEIFGDYLAQREKYKSHKGLDAVHFYLVCKYGWLPSVARSLSFDDLNFLLAEEMHGWTLPPEAR
ncbi:hypothetical protein SAMN06265338_103274 [Rhodoblastus acidophilus]|uniref:Uncharacterized protein n=1 Tax=Rhodoblastus acidophilus TaxID=1074 RepID=A0A212RBV0_RHOAC|nr:hypothetical protein [Rhodoblastus acidophilus]PPQ39423.1 hypothetical protein CKO16_06635 [Rhodoblastus acidophilus]RAI19445.1 hypothetical protein CH337_11825 [Rhodoblastus acidophilus]SNB69699.1 hypothetical protein SAMN06265338_103274 [Rhodoblastus acidophilus]